VPLVNGNQFYPYKKTRERLLTLNTSNPNQTGAPYDIWCNHITFDPVLVEEAVPSSGGKVMSIVRDPAAHLWSSASWFRCAPYESRADWDRFILSMEDRLAYDKAVRFLCKSEENTRAIVGTKVPPSNPNNSTENRAFAAKFEEVESKVERGDYLLLVTERMEESMLAMWHFYGLHPLDITYASKKVNSRNIASATNEDADHERAEQRVRNWSHHDSRLHILANRILSERMATIFPDPAVRAQSLVDFSTLNDIVSQICGEDLAEIAPGLNYWCHLKDLDNKPWVDEQKEALNRYFAGH
jgi:hypothetical protein